jgi:uncharacterized protein (DUF4415 family)
MEKTTERSEPILTQNRNGSPNDKHDYKNGKKAISLRLDQELIDQLTLAGERRGIGYQTMARLILKEKIAEYVAS